jgi:DHA1 family tetracycline resistance protein-like MFS transporter
MPAVSPSPPFRSPIVTIFLTVFLDLLGIGIVVPIVVPLLFQSNDILGASVSLIERTRWQGVLIGAFTLCAFISSPLLGSLSDKYGRRVVLNLSLLATIAGYLSFAWGIHTHSLALLIGGRALSGLAAGNLSVIYSALADVSTDPGTKAKNFGLIGAAFGLGFLMGPVFGAFLSNRAWVAWFDYSTPYWVSAVLATVNLVLIYLYFPETLRTPNRQAVVSAWTGFRNLQKGFSDDALRSVFAVVFFGTLGFAFFVQYFQNYLSVRFQFTEQDIGYFFGVIGLWSIITQAGLLRVLAGRIAPERILLFSLLGTTVAFLVLLVPTQGLMMYLLIPLVSIPSGLTTPNLASLVSNAAPAELQGETLGIQQSVQTMAQFIASVAGGYALGFGVEMALILASAFTGVAWLLFVLSRRGRAAAVRPQQS